MQASDWRSVQQIYQQGIDTKNATFEMTAPTWEVWNAKHLAPCRLVARCGDVLAGWAALSPVSVRAVYRGVAEVSIYIGPGYQGQGLGDTLMATLVEQSEQAGLWTLQASIFPENNASVQLHAKHGFRIVGQREKIAQREGIWRDTMLLERRSLVTGL